MNIYQYVTESNPYFTRSLINKYGYGLNKNGNLAVALQQLVAAEGQPVLEAIIENHPDKELFQDFFAEKSKQENGTEKKLGCNGGCAGCAGKTEAKPAYVGFTGIPQEVEKSQAVTSSTSMIMLASAVLIAFAILMKPSN